MIPSLTEQLAHRHPAQIGRVLASLRPAPHGLGPEVRHAALALPALEPLLDAIDTAALPAATHRMARPRLRTFLAGRLCAEHALSQLGLAPRWIAQGALGAPAWPAGVVGSIAHTDELACAAVAPANASAGIGIDSERCADAATAEHIRRACCTARENTHLFGSDDDDALTATLVFSAKESYYKAVGATVGRMLEFDEVEVQHIDRTATRVALAPVTAALAGAAPEAEVQWRLVEGRVHTWLVLPPGRR